MKPKNNKDIYYILVIFAIVMLPLGLYFFKFHGPLSNERKDWIDFATYIGGVLGPALAMLSVLGILITLRTQSENHSEQQFYSSLFQLLSMQRQLFAGYKRNDPALGNVEGFEAFAVLVREMKTKLGDISQNSSSSYITQAYSSLSLYPDVRLRTYITATTNLLGFICFSSQSKQLKINAFQIVIGNMSKDELTILLFEVTLNKDHGWIRGQLESQRFFSWGSTDILNSDKLWEIIPLNQLT